MKFNFELQLCRLAAFVHFLFCWEKGQHDSATQVKCICGENFDLLSGGTEVYDTGATYRLFSVGCEIDFEFYSCFSNIILSLSISPNT